MSESEICSKCRFDLGKHCEEAELSEVTMECGIVIKCPFFKTKEVGMFYIIRNKDESGISGIGRVLNGIVFPDGITVIRWCSDNLNASPSTCVYDSFKDFKYYHIDCHPTNETEIVWCRGWWD